MIGESDVDLTEVSWENKIKAFLHDPPDKALCISGHIQRSSEILKSIHIGGKNDSVNKADRWASSIQRISWLSEGKEPLIDFCMKEWGDVEYTGQPVLKHTLSAAKKEYGTLNKNHLDKILEIEKQTIMALTEKAEVKDKYFKIWRYFKDELQKNIEMSISKDVAEDFVNLPADTRVPDHTIWDHLDVTSALYGAIERVKPSLLMFKISPVQSFITNSRKEEDLWAGSHIMSFLTFQGMKTIIDTYGPDAFVYPHLRGLPLMDLEYFKVDDKDSLRLATIPNKFLAIVSLKDADILETEIRGRVSNSWNNLAKYVIKNVVDEDEFRRQVEGQWRITIKTLEFPDDPAGFIERNKNNIPSEVYSRYSDFISNLKLITRYNLTPIDNYGLIFELLQSIVDYESKHTVSPVSLLPETKCTICGEKVAVTNAGKKLKDNEKLCGVCLVKRYYRDSYSDYVKKNFGVEINTISIPVAEIAMRKGSYLEEIQRTEEYDRTLNAFKAFEEIADIGWDIEYLYDISRGKIEQLIEKLKKKLPDKLGFHNDYFTTIDSSMKYLKKNLSGAPPSYYGILVMDGDNMGVKLRGDGLQYLEKYLHPSVVVPEGEAFSKVFETKRRLTPTIHTAISRSLMEFALNDITKIVEQHRGELIYTGGDDVLALLPTDTILKCANEIQQSFKKEFDGWRQYPSGTMSAGILIVKYNYPLYDALEKARALEKTAKDNGRNRFCIGYLKGTQMYESGAKWDILTVDDGFFDVFLDYILKENISPKFIYDFMKLSNDFEMDEDAFRSLLKVELDRHASKDFKKSMKERIGVKWNDEIARKLLSLKSFTDNISTAYFSIAVLLKIFFEMKRDKQ